MEHHESTNSPIAAAYSLGDIEAPFPAKTFGDYYGNPELRSLAHGIREKVPFSLIRAAQLFSASLPPGGILIPMPSHTGHADSMLRLCHWIRSYRHDLAVLDMLSCAPRESYYEVKKQGANLPPSEFRITASPSLLRLPFQNVYLLDNVIATGTTALSAMKLFQESGSNVTFLALADDSQAKKIWIVERDGLSDSRIRDIYKEERYKHYEDYLCELCAKYGSAYYFDRSGLLSLLLPSEKAEYLHRLADYRSAAGMPAVNPDELRPSEKAVKEPENSRAESYGDDDIRESHRAFGMHR